MILAISISRSAGLIGATYNPWMVFYQASAVAEKRLSPADYSAARWDTAVGAILTQLVTASVLIAIAALKQHGTGAPLGNIGEISEVLTPLLGQTNLDGWCSARASSARRWRPRSSVRFRLPAWGLGEIFLGSDGSLEREAAASPWFFLRLHNLGRRQRLVGSVRARSGLAVDRHAGSEHDPVAHCRRASW